jgi:hypothetical protein
MSIWMNAARAGANDSTISFGSGKPVSLKADGDKPVAVRKDVLRRMNVAKLLARPFLDREIRNGISLMPRQQNNRSGQFFVATTELASVHLATRSQSDSVFASTQSADQQGFLRDLFGNPTEAGVAATHMVLSGAMQR